MGLSHLRGDEALARPVPHAGSVARPPAEGRAPAAGRAELRAVLAREALRGASQGQASSEHAALEEGVHDARGHDPVAPAVRVACHLAPALEHDFAGGQLEVCKESPGLVLQPLLHRGVDLVDGPHGAVPDIDAVLLGVPCQHDDVRVGVDLVDGADEAPSRGDGNCHGVDLVDTGGPVAAVGSHPLLRVVDPVRKDDDVRAGGLLCDSGRLVEDLGGVVDLPHAAPSIHALHKVASNSSEAMVLALTVAVGLVGESPARPARLPQSRCQQALNVLGVVAARHPGRL
mmetsp:Transcript_37206/g.107177  ORF Transcript_37206/g.107177 Transcript_37206/m.107177 type:complete len:287 (-) Transcript_37206:444-1304(-)